MSARSPSKFSSLALVALTAAGMALLTQAVSAVRGAGAAPAPVKVAKPPAAPVSAASPAPSSVAKINFQDNIQPILRENCFDCHNPDTKKSGLDLTSISSILAGSSNGKVAKPGDPDGSKLIRLLAHQEQPYMPQDADKLSEKDLGLIKTWIAQGMRDSANSQVAIVQNTSPLAIAAAAVGRPAGPPPMPTVALPMTLPVHTGRPSPLASLATSPWAPLAAIGGQRSVLLYNTNTLALLGVLPFPEGLPDTLRFSRNGSLLIAAGGQGAQIGKVAVYSVTSGKRIAEVGNEFDQVLAADISPDQSQVALGGPSKLLKVFATSDPLKPIYVIKKHTDWVTAIAFSPDGKLLASGDRAGNLFLFLADSGGEMFTLPGHRDAISAVAFRDDGNALASASQDGTVKLWDTHSGDLIKSISVNNSGVMDVAFSHDGQIVIAGRDKIVRLFNSDGGAVRSFGPFADAALHAVFTDDAHRIIAGDWSGEIAVFNTADASKIGQLWSDPLTSEELTAHRAEAQKHITEVEARQKQAAAALTAAQAQATQADNELRAARSARSAVDLALRHATDALLGGSGAPPNSSSSLHAPPAPAPNASTADQLKTLRQALSEADTRVGAAEQAARQAQDALALAKAVADSTAVDLAVASDLLARYQTTSPPGASPSNVVAPGKTTVGSAGGATVGTVTGSKTARAP